MLVEIFAEQMPIVGFRLVVHVLSSEAGGKVRICGCRNFYRFRRHVLVPAKGESKTLHRLPKLGFDIALGFNNLVGESGSVRRGAIEVRPGVAAELCSSE